MICLNDSKSSVKYISIIVSTKVHLPSFVSKSSSILDLISDIIASLKNGKKKKKKIRGKIESDWKDYYGSSDALTADIQALGKENFTREILFYCKNKSECSYIEAREQFKHKVLESTDWYNGHIQVRVHGSHILKKPKK